MKKFKFISLVAAGVAAATAVTASALSLPKVEEVKLTDFEEQLLCGIYPCGEASPEECEAAEENYKIGLLMEHGVITSAHSVGDVIGEDGLTERDREAENIVAGQKPVPLSEQYKDELNAILAEKENESTGLTKVQSAPYFIRSGRFISDEPGNCSLYLDDPYFFSMAVWNGKNITVTPKTNYNGRFKTADVYATYINSATGELKKTKASADGAGNLTLKPESLSGWTLVETAIYAYVYKGESISTPYDEMVVIHLVDRTYAKSAQYAENSYAGLIDQYTYIEN